MLMLNSCVIFGVFAAVLLVSCGNEHGVPGVDTADTGSVILSVTDTIGVEIGDSCFMFGYAVDAARTDSIVYVLDMSRARLQKYYPDGSYAGFIGGSGDGPGELFMPHCLAFFPDGSFLIQDITDLGYYNSSGEWLSHVFTHAGNWPRDHTVTGSASFAVKWHEFINVDSPILRKFIASYDLQGNLIHEFMTDPIPIPSTPENNTDVLNRSFFSHHFTSDLNGNVYMVQRHTPDYSIVCFNSAGVPFDTLTLEIPVVAKTDEEVALEKRHTEEYLTGMGTSNVMQWIYEPDSFREPIAGIWLGWNENLWVLRGTEDAPAFDVWSIPEGELLYSAHLDLHIPAAEFLTFYITPWCEDFLAVYEDEGMVQRILLIDAEYPPQVFPDS